MREEYGLLNRLDTDTSGMVYFARSRVVYVQRRDLQREGKVQKWYLAKVEGNVERKLKEIEGNEGNEGNDAEFLQNS
ncbi:hypothetical protein KA405_00400 [Patescibacteria group bacterium]|nr:hypothetical protein [Patescibacteria group bacterium]